MKLAELIAIAAVASILTQTSVFAQETPPAVVPVPEKAPATEQPKSDSDKAPATEKPNSDPAPEKKYSLGPAIEFGDGGTNFGITGRYSIGEQFSVRPIVLFGRKTTVTTSNLTQAIGGSYTTTDINNIAKSVEDFSGLGYGISATYDFKSADGKIVGYVGPRILSSGVSVTGTKGFTPVKIDITEINVGLIAGADFALAPDLTAGINATYNFYRGVRIDSADIQNLGSTTNFGINVIYSF
jgi:Outer membrane protein beta-barrel domain